MQADVIVIGAGAAGLMAAAELLTAGKKVILLEAAAQAGGRIRTVADSAFEQPVEGGAEFVHGKLPLTHALLKKAGLQTVEAGGSIWRSRRGKLKKEEDFIAEYDVLMQALKGLKQDVTVARFLQTYFASPKYQELQSTLQNYVEGYYAGDVQRASAFALREELEGADDGDERIIGGYGQLVRHLQQQCEAAGGTIYFNAPVSGLQWQQGAVSVTTKEGKVYRAAKAIITVSVGVLQKGFLTFHPAIDAKMHAVQQLGFGAVIKVVMQLKEPFWVKDYALDGLAFLFSNEQIPTWWTQHPQKSNVLTGWCAGPAAAALKEQTNKALFEKAVASLANCFELNTEEVKEKINVWKVFNWAADKYTCGGYSYLTVQSKEAIKEVTTPVENTLYFAGEGLQYSMQIGTVEAALQSGRQAAQQLLGNSGY